MKTNNKQKLILSLAAIMASQAFPLSTFALPEKADVDKTEKPAAASDVHVRKKGPVTPITPIEPLGPGEPVGPGAPISEEATKVIAKINALPEAGALTLDNADDVEAARKAYDALSDAQKLHVKNTSKLLMAEAKIQELKEAKKESDKLKELQKQADEDAVKVYSSSSVKFVNGVNNGRVTIEIPEAKSGYAAKLTVKDKATDATLATKDGISALSLIDVAYLGSGKIYGINIDVVRKSDNAVVGNFKTDLAAPEIKAPVLKYAYVYDGGLIVNIQSDAGIDEIYWAYKGEKDFRKLSDDAGYGKKYTKSKKDETTYLGAKTKDFSDLFKGTDVEIDKYTRLDKDDYRINVKIPSTVEIVAIDKIGNKTPISIRVKEDNSAITKNVPSNVEKALKENNNFSYQDKDKYKDLIVVERNTIVDMFNIFEEYIVDKLGSFNTRDLEWSSPEITDKINYTGVYKFTKDGVFRIEVRDADSKKSCTVTVIVNSGANNVKDYSLDKKEVKVDKDKFKPIDALKITTYDNKDINPVHFIALIDGQYYKITDEIEFKDKDGKDVDKVKVQIINLKDDKKYDVTFEKGVVAGTADFNDISGHWAEKMIKDLAKKGIVAGYGENNFKPDNMITIRETLAIVGRHVARNEAQAGKEVSNFNLVDKDAKANWSYKDINRAANTMPNNIFKGKDITNEAITREEVAYLLRYAYNINSGNKEVELTDVDEAKYKAQIDDLTSAGVIAGYPDGTFKPDLQITRAELVSLLYNLPGTWK